MNKKIIVVILIGILIAALIAFMWWWFFNRAPSLPTKTGNFGSAQNRSGSGAEGTNPTNIGSNTIGTNTNNKKILGNGTYTFKSSGGTPVGSYSVTRDSATGQYTVVPQGGSAPLTQGTFVITLNGGGGSSGDSFIAVNIYTSGGSSVYDFNPWDYTGTGTTSTTYQVDYQGGGQGGSGPGTNPNTFGFNYDNTSTTTSGGPRPGSGFDYSGNPIGNTGGGPGTGSSTGTVGNYTGGGSGTGGNYAGGGNYTGAGNTGGEGGGTGGNYSGTGGDGSGENYTSGSDWLSIPPIDFGNINNPLVINNAPPVTNVGNPTSGSTAGDLGIGGGLNIAPQAPGTIFSSENPFNTGTVPTIGSSNSSGPNNHGLGIGGAFAGSVIAGGVACVLPAIAKYIGGSFALAVTGRGTAAAGALKSKGAVLAAGATVAATVPTNNIPQTTSQSGTSDTGLGNAIAGAGTDIATNLGLSVQLSELIKTNVLDCFARTIAHAALEQIARSTVQWINSGFNGQPSFVTNYSQFFTNVADKAAGDFLKSSALSFLCSPFQLQVKIAIAQSYKSSGRSGGQCSLTSVIGNVNQFMNGNFASGGWPGLLSFTTVPTNNPYGAFAAGSIGIKAAGSNAAGESKFDLSLSGGFLSIKQAKNCRTSAAMPDIDTSKQTAFPNKNADGTLTGTYTYCDNVNVTPGTAIAQTLDQTLGINTQSLETAKYFDEILSALVTKLIQNVSSQGLLNLSSGSNSSNQYVSTNINVNSAGSIQQSISQNIPGLKQSANDLKDYSKQNIAKIKAVIDQEQGLRTCWVSLANSTTTSTTTASKARQNVSKVDSILGDLSGKINVYQGNINKADSNIQSLQSYQSQIDSTTDLNRLQNVMAQLATQIADQSFAQNTDVVNAQEDQVGLDSHLDDLKQNISTQKQQCEAGDTNVVQPSVDFTSSPSANTTVPTTDNTGGSDGGI